MACRDWRRQYVGQQPE